MKESKRCVHYGYFLDMSFKLKTVYRLSADVGSIGPDQKIVKDFATMKQAKDAESELHSSMVYGYVSSSIRDVAL